MTNIKPLSPAVHLVRRTPSRVVALCEARGTHGSAGLCRGAPSLESSWPRCLRFKRSRHMAWAQSFGAATGNTEARGHACPPCSTSAPASVAFSLRPASRACDCWDLQREASTNGLSSSRLEPLTSREIAERAIHCISYSQFPPCGRQSARASGLEKAGPAMPPFQGGWWARRTINGGILRPLRIGPCGRPILTSDKNDEAEKRVLAMKARAASDVCVSRFKAHGSRGWKYRDNLAFDSGDYLCGSTLDKDKTCLMLCWCLNKAAKR